MNRLKDILHEQGRSQQFLCRQLDKSTNTVSLWCRNLVQPSVSDLYRIAELLDCEVSDLLKERKELKKLEKHV